MPGKIKRMIDKVVEQRSQGEPLLVTITQTKLVLKGIDPKKYDENSPDDLEVIQKLRQVAGDLGVII